MHCFSAIRCDNQLDRPDLEKKINEDRESEIGNMLSDWDEARRGSSGKTFRDKYCEGSNELGVRRSDGHISTYVSMAEDGTVIYEWP